MTTTLYALHGFLGTPADWDALLKKNELKYALKAPNLFEKSPSSTLLSWAKDFNQEAANFKGKRYLMGYSLGGRLALHALLQNPSLWNAAIIISANPGLTSQEEKLKKSQENERWAHRFENEAWEQLMKEWNEQGVFKESFTFERREKDYSRSALAAALRNWSLDSQENLTSKIATLSQPILWIVGDKDPKLSYLNQLTLKNPLSKICRIPDAGHRAPWQQPAYFLDLVDSFLLPIL